MLDPLANVSPGQKVRHNAERVNAWNDAAKRVRSLPKGGPGDVPRIKPLDAVVISVQLTGGKVINMGGVVGFNDIIFKPADGKPVSLIAFEADKPTQENIERGQFAILAEPANPGKGLYHAYLAGAFPAQVHFNSINDTHARVVADQSESLEGASGGEYRVLWSPGETGLKWAIVTPNILPTGKRGQGLFVTDDTGTFRPAFPFFVLHDPADDGEEP